MLVLVLGETGRSGNFGLNGYERDTTPEPRLQAPSPMPGPAAPVPRRPCPACSRRSGEGYLARAQDTKPWSMSQHAGLAVLWIDNQPGLQGCATACRP